MRVFGLWGVLDCDCMLALSPGFCRAMYLLMCPRCSRIVPNVPPSTASGASSAWRDAGARDQTPRSDKSVISCTAVRGARSSTANSAQWSGSRALSTFGLCEASRARTNIHGCLSRHACSMKDHGGGRAGRARIASLTRMQPGGSGASGDSERQTRALEIRHRAREPRTTRALSEEWCTGMLVQNSSRTTYQEESHAER